MSTPPDDDRPAAEPTRPASYPAAPPYPPPYPPAAGPAAAPAGWPPGPYLPPPRSEGFFWKPVLRAAGKTAAVLTVLILMGALLVAVVGLATRGDDGPRPLATSYVAGDAHARDRLLAVRVSGPILGEAEGTGLLGLGGTVGYRVKDQLARAAGDPSIRGVVLEMATPGGTIHGARAIADGVEDYQKRTGRKVVAYVSSLSASGGMYAMAGADRIVADRGTLTGSIGVIYGPITFYDRPTALDRGAFVGGVETRNGITVQYITAGRGKDAGNPFRRLTAEERGVIQRGVTREYGDFVDWVSQARGIPREQIVERIGAHVYDERTARDLRLVDEVGSRDDAYALAAELNAVQRYRVDRLDSGDGGLLGGLVRRPGAEPAAPLCSGRPALLAYAGDLARLCE